MWSNFYAAGGWGMYPTSLFGFFLIAAAVLYALRPGPRSARVALTLGGVTFASGLLGTFVGFCNSMHYIPQVAAQKQVEILALGCEESLHVTVLALILVVLAGLVAGVGAARSSNAPVAA
ncbi:MAG TPA: hypothetical protein VLM85_08735 [Polyangiaceae bacterium]|nr:hypothetical protein [Polyangiaceae bacterium]